MSWKLYFSITVLACLFPGRLPAQARPEPVELTIDAHAPGTPFPHFWEQMFGSGRAILSLHDSYRKDLRTVKQATDFQYVRFHAIFHDETGFFDLDAAGKPVYNFAYIDQIYDRLLENGVRPFVELSFMPKKLAADPAMLHSFWYKQNNVLQAFAAMGRPASPSREQLVQLRKAGEASPPEAITLKNGKLIIEVPPQGLVLLEVT